jgi:hypothetical protein
LASLPSGGSIGGLVITGCGTTLTLRRDTEPSNSDFRETFSVSSCLLVALSGVDTVDGMGSGVAESVDGNVVSNG